MWISPLMRSFMAAKRRAHDEAAGSCQPVSPPACTIAPSLDSLHPAFEEPVIGYLSKTGYRLFREEPDWHTKLCRDQAELNAKGGVVEVEIRVRRVIQR